MKIKETVLNDLAKEFSINIGELTIEITLDKERMKELGMNDQKIQKKLQEGITGITIKNTDDGFIIKPKKKEEESLNELYKLKEKLKEMFITGVKGIKQVLPVKRKEEWLIITSGTNMKDILKMEEADTARTITNDIYEVEKHLGIEAARQAIINEIFRVIEDQGLNIDIRHIMLAADTMCMTGEIKGITRYGIVGEKVSVLARASFETPIKHIIDAALVGEVDNLNSVVENAMLNQPVPMGTGLPGLITKK
jgi:DNA-directed RNA polymerase subunit A"